MKWLLWEIKGSVEFLWCKGHFTLREVFGSAPKFEIKGWWRPNKMFDQHVDRLIAFLLVAKSGLVVLIIVYYCCLVVV